MRPAIVAQTYLTITAELICTCYLVNVCFTGTGSKRRDSVGSFRQKKTPKHIRWQSPFYFPQNPGLVESSYKPCVATHFWSNVHVLLLSTVFPRSVSPSVSAWRPANRCWPITAGDALSHLYNQGYLMRPLETWGEGEIGERWRGGESKNNNIKKKVQAVEKEEEEGGKRASKNNEAKSEDKRGTISAAGFMYCQHYPRY